MKRTLLFAVAVVLSASPAFATGPSGSTEGGPGSSSYNNVSCGSGTSVAGVVLYAGANGAEVCNDGKSPVPVQGRVIASTDQGGYIAADGDKDNTQNAYLQGYLRIDRNGPHCGKPGNVEDATSTTQPSTNTCP
jgi:hypothetical protein